MAANSVRGYFRINLAKRWRFGPTSGYAIKTSGASAMASISASAMVAHLCFNTPAASCSFVSSTVLWVLQCGRNRPGPPAMAMTSAMFRRMMSGKKMSDGLGIAASSIKRYGWGMVLATVDKGERSQFYQFRGGSQPGEFDGGPARPRGIQWS